MAENYIDKIEVDGVERPIRDTAGSVRYDAPQSLSDAQKEQALANINAAPGGFGWGGNAAGIPAGADLNSYVKTGRYAQGTTSVMKQILNLPDAFSDGGIVLDVLAVSPTYAAQIAYNLRDNKDIITAMRQNYVGAWQPWEYVNPPMQLGIEYRTTERYLGKPVYTKAVNFGAMPNNSAKAVNHGIANMDMCFLVYGHDTGNHRPIPTMCLSGNFTEQVGITVTGTDIIIHTTFDARNDEAIVVMKYTKTTD